MATDSSVFHDSSLIAAANYGNGANLAGANVSGTTGTSAGSGQYLAVVQSTSADGTAVLASSVGQQAIGILQNKPAAGQACDIAFGGISKFVAGGGITRGDRLMTKADGTLQTWTAGSGYAQVGVAIDSVASGAIGRCWVNPAAPKVLT